MIHYVIDYDQGQELSPLEAALLLALDIPEDPKFGDGCSTFSKETDFPYICCRDEHTGPHVAVNSSGEVCAVWS